MVLTVRIPDSLRKRLRMFADVNWSQVVRGALEERVKREMSTRRGRDINRVIRAVRVQDEAARKTAKHRSELSTVEVIRWWREHRYSSSTPR